MFRFFRKSAVSPAARSKRRRFRPAVEFLEDRMAPAVFAPSAAAADTAPGSLRNDLIDANSNGQDNVFSLEAGTYGLTFTQPGGHDSTSASGNLVLTAAGHTIILQGAGPNQTFINANHIDRVFEVLPNVTVVFRNLTLLGGRAQDDGTPGSTNTTADAFGGGILNEGGNVTLDNVHIANCEALAGPARAAAGGGIYSSGGSLTLINSTLQGDSALGGTGADGTNANPSGGKGGDSQGGGVYALGTAVSLVNDGFFLDVAGGGLGGAGKSQPGFAANGGAGGAGGSGQGGGLYTGIGTVAITDTTFESNNAGGANGGKGGDGTPGGGPDVPGGDGGGGGTGGNAQGGGIYVASGTVTDSRTTLDANAVNGGTGGFGGNGGSSELQGGNGGRGGQGGDAQGGGVFAANGTVNLSNATVSGNSTDSNSGFGAGGTGGNLGAGIGAGADGSYGHGGNAGLTQGGGLFIGPATVNVHNSTVAFNQALTNQGGGGGGGIPALGGSSSLGQGGGVRINGTFRAVSSIFAADFVNGGATDVDVSGSFSLADHILLGINTGSALAAGNPGVNGNLVGTAAAPIDPKLALLADNGGPTETHALQPGSPAINKGSNPDGLTTDQRGFGPRNAGGGVDIGAFQLGAAPLPPAPPPGPAPVVHGVTPRVVKVKSHRQLRVFDADTGALRFAVYPFGKGFGGNFAVATRDVNGDGFVDVLVTARLGRKRVVTRVFSGLDGAILA